MNEKMIGPQKPIDVFNFFKKTGHKVNKTTYEDELYLWIEHGFNEKCLLCKKNCKQHGGCVLLECKKFESVIDIQKKTKKKGK